MSAGDPYKATGGSFVCPITSIELNAGRVKKRTLRMTNITAPSDNGVVNYCEGNYTYEFSGRGTYVEGANATDDLDEGTTGTLTVTVGNGEQWTGSCIITQIEASSDWGPGGQIGVVFSAVWTGAVTITNT